MDKDAKIPEDDWKKTWKPGTYDYLDPEYKPGTHEVERGDVTWHQLRALPTATLQTSHLLQVELQPSHSWSDLTVLPDSFWETHWPRECAS